MRIDESADYDATVAAVQEIVDGYPGLSRAVQTYLDERSGVAAERPRVRTSPSGCTGRTARS